MVEITLIEAVIAQIKLDLEFPDNDLTALETLLENCSIEALEAYLPEQ